MRGSATYHLLAKPTGAICNLDCKYCFFLSKEMLYPGSRFRMADELLEAYIDQLVGSHAAQEVVVAFQGGEPTLMGVDFFRRAVAHAERRRRPGQKLSYTTTMRWAGRTPWTPPISGPNRWPPTGAARATG